MVAKDKTITVLVSTGVILILACALIASIASESQLKTTQTLVSSEAIDITSARMGGTMLINTSKSNFTLTEAYRNSDRWKMDYSDCDIAIAGTYGNGSTTFTVTTDYTLSVDGILHIENSTAIKASPVNATTISYKYCADDYLASSWGRNILNLTPGLIAVAILVIAIVAAVVLLKREGED